MHFQNFAILSILNKYLWVGELVKTFSNIHYHISAPQVFYGRLNITK